MTRPQPFGRPELFALLALLPISACSWPLTLAWAHVLYLPVTTCLIGSVLGLWIGGRRARRGEAARWRRDGDRPNSSHRVESGGRLYWVVGEDAPPSSRFYVAEMLTADAAYVGGEALASKGIEAREARLRALGFKPRRSMLGSLLSDPAKSAGDK